VVEHGGCEPPDPLPARNIVWGFWRCHETLLNSKSVLSSYVCNSGWPAGYLCPRTGASQRPTAGKSGCRCPRRPLLCERNGQARGHFPSSCGIASSSTLWRFSSARAAAWTWCPHVHWERYRRSALRTWRTSRGDRRSRPAAAGTGNSTARSWPSPAGCPGRRGSARKRGRHA
jgi:hypothetical protein